METNTAPASVKAFKVGKTYSCKSPCDQNCVWSFEVVSRTAKRVTLRGNFMAGGVENRSFGVKIWDGAETVKPLGSYSMAPTLRA